MDYNVIIAILCTAAVFCIVCFVLHRRYRRTIGKVTFLFNLVQLPRTEARQAHQRVAQPHSPHTRNGTP